MLSLDPKIVVLNLAIKHGARPVKQAQRFFRPDIIPKTEEELNKLIDIGFIREIKYRTWISRIISVKKNGQIHMCVNLYMSFPVPSVGPYLRQNASQVHQGKTTAEVFAYSPSPYQNRYTRGPATST